MKGFYTMDIYSFIRSPEVGEHCRNIGKTWNTLEMAVIIDRSKRTIIEKHAAWTELVEGYPDMPAIPNFHDVHFDSVHEMIATRIVYERQAIEFFKRPINGVFYQYFCEYVGTHHITHSPYFSTFEKAFADLKECWKESELSRVYFSRVVLDDGLRLLDVNIDHNGNFYGVNVYEAAEAHKWSLVVPRDKGRLKSVQWHGFEFAELFFIDIPIPFRRGDILTSVEHGNQEVFVLDEAYIIDNSERYARCLRGEIADGGDIGGNGLFVNNLGVLYWDHTADYDTWVSYDEELKGNDRLLYYVNLYLNDKISLNALLYMQCKFMTEHILNSNFGLDQHDCYIPESLIYENRNK